MRLYLKLASSVCNKNPNAKNFKQISIHSCFCELQLNKIAQQADQTSETSVEGLMLYPRATTPQYDQHELYTGSYHLSSVPVSSCLSSAGDSYVHHEECSLAGWTHLES